MKLNLNKTNNMHWNLSYYRQYHYHYYYYCATLILFIISGAFERSNCQTIASEQLSAVPSQTETTRPDGRLDPTGYFAPDSLHTKYTNKLTFNEYVTYAGHSLAMVAGFDNELHRYDDKQHLVDSFERNQSASSSSAALVEDINYLANARYDSSEFELMHDQADSTLVENELNQAKCARQLDFLYEQALKLYKDYGSYTQSRRLDLIDLFDSYGPAPGEQLMMGNTVWLGSFQQCQRARVQMSSLDNLPPASGHKDNSNNNNNNNYIAGRYCVAHLRLPNKSRAPSSPSSSPSSLPSSSQPSSQPSSSSVNNANSSMLIGGGDIRARAGTGYQDGGALLKLGICLPNACNSISVLRHSNRIEALIKLVRLQQVPYSGSRLTQLYCLPDENSPLRQLSLSARLFIALASCWLGLIVLISVKYEYAKAKQAALIKHRSGQRWQQHQGQRNNCANNDEDNCTILEGSADQVEAAAAHLLCKDKLVQIFAFRHAWQQLFSTGEGSSDDRQAAAAASKKLAPADSSVGANSNHLGTSQDDGARQAAAVAASGNGMVTMKQNLAALKVDLPKSIFMKIHTNCCDYQPDISSGCRQAASSQAPLSPPSTIVKSNGSGQQQRQQQLSAIDGIKVISMIWLISAHTLLLFVRNITNGRDFWSLLLDARFMTVMAGIFPVDSFFTITGILTIYLKFNKSPRDQARKSLTNISYWLEIFVHRYLRFMPMYLLIFWYTRDVSEYIGQGPMWDYATANTSLRSMCKRESILVPVLFQANFKSIDQHCIKPAWYLANDYQYLLITPFFIMLLLLSKWVGYLAIGLGIGASLVLQFLTVYHPAVEKTGATFTDFEAMANFRPMFAAYILKDLWRLYGLPYNRIAPYLIGLLTGHLMYRHNKHISKQRSDATAPSSQQPTRRQSESSSSHASTESLVLSSDGSQTGTTTCNGDHNLNQREHNSRQAQTQEPPLPMSAPSAPASKLNGIETPPYHHANGRTTATATVSDIGLLVAFVRNHINTKIWLPLVVLLSVIYSPLATKVLEPLSGEQARVGASLLIALLRFAWSMAIARLIYVCFVANTMPAKDKQQNGSFIVDFLSSPKWKPWSKIGLSVLLIQWEVIGYLVQIQNGPPYMSISFLLTAMIGCVVVSYALGLLIYLTFEYPLSQIERLYIKPELFGTNKK